MKTGRADAALYDPLKVTFMIGEIKYPRVEMDEGVDLLEMLAMVEKAKSEGGLKIGISKNGRGERDMLVETKVPRIPAYHILQVSLFLLKRYEV